MKARALYVSLTALAGLITFDTCFAGPGTGEVQECVEAIWKSLAQCPQFVALESVKKIDSRETADEAHIIAELSVRVHQQMGQDSMAATDCTGTSWNLPRKQQFTTAETLMGARDPINVGQLLILRKEFVFQKWQSGWRCADTTLSPLQASSAVAWLQAQQQGVSGATTAQGQSADPTECHAYEQKYPGKFSNVMLAVQKGFVLVQSDVDFALCMMTKQEDKEAFLANLERNKQQKAKAQH